jgi:hypothetical protein
MRESLQKFSTNIFFVIVDTVDEVVGDRGYVGNFFSFRCHLNKTKNYEKIKVGETGAVWDMGLHGTSQF